MVFWSSDDKVIAAGVNPPQADGLADGLRGAGSPPQADADRFVYLWQS